MREQERTPQAHRGGREEQMFCFTLFSDVDLSDSLMAVMRAHLSSTICIPCYSPNTSNSSYCILTECN